MRNSTATHGHPLLEHAALISVVAAAVAAIAFVIVAPGGFEPEDDDGLPASPLPPGVHLAAAAHVPVAVPRAAAPAAPAPSLPDLDLAVTADEHEVAARLTSRLEKLARDLEFTPGLREPPQSIVRASAEPWRPEPLAGDDAKPVIREVAPREAPAAGGAAVTIRGSNLRASQVMFGAASAPIVHATAEAITVLAPRSAPGPVSIVVTNDDGTYAIAGAPFTYCD